MKVDVVLDLGFGDGGKGTMVDYLTMMSPSSSKLIVRFSGGPQAGHTVWRQDGRKHVFSNFGAGSFNENTDTFWSRFCPVDPVGFLREYDILKSKVPDAGPWSYVDVNCPIITPYDKAFNQSDNLTHGTCGVGIRPTLVREERLYSLKVGDLSFPQIFIQKYLLIKKYYGDYTSWKLQDEGFWHTCFRYMKHILPWDSPGLPDYRHYIFEGSQGLLLDPKHGFFPHVTSTDVDLTNVYKLLPPGTPFNTHLVTRAYQTRHGNGPMFDKDIDKFQIIENQEETNITNKYQGDLRRNYLSLEYLMYALTRLDSKLNFKLLVSCVDQMKDNYCIYDFDGALLKFESANDFLTYLTKELRSIRSISEVYANVSPYTETIYKWQ